MQCIYVCVLLVCAQRGPCRPCEFLCSLNSKHKQLPTNKPPHHTSPPTPLSPHHTLQATATLRDRLASQKPATFVLLAQGLVLSGHDPEPWLVNQLLTASSPKLPKMDVGDLQVMVGVSI